MKPWNYVFLGLVIAGVLDLIAVIIFFLIDPAQQLIAAE